MGRKKSETTAVRLRVQLALIDWSASDLARAAGVTPAAATAWLRGDRTPSEPSRRAIAAALVAATGDVR